MINQFQTNLRTWIWICQSTWNAHGYWVVPAFLAIFAAGCRPILEISCCPPRGFGHLHRWWQRSLLQSYANHSDQIWHALAWLVWHLRVQHFELEPFENCNSWGGWNQSCPKKAHSWALFGIDPIKSCSLGPRAVWFFGMLDSACIWARRGTGDTSRCFSPAMDLTASKWEWFPDIHGLTALEMLWEKAMVNDVKTSNFWKRLSLHPLFQFSSSQAWENRICETGKGPLQYPKCPFLPFPLETCPIRPHPPPHPRSSVPQAPTTCWGWVLKAVVAWV